MDELEGRVGGQGLKAVRRLGVPTPRGQLTPDLRPRGGRKPATIDDYRQTIATPSDRREQTLAADGNDILWPVAGPLAA